VPERRLPEEAMVMRGPLRPTWWLLVLVVPLAVSGCSGPGGEMRGDPAGELSGPTEAPTTPTDEATPPPPAERPRTPTADEEEEPAASPQPAEPEPTPPGSDVELQDGRHPAFLVQFDVPGRRVTFDLIQFLVGEEAIAAYREDGRANPEDPDPPNDYYIRNVNPRLRTLPISGEAAVTVVRLGEPSGSGSVPWTLAELPRHLSERGTGPEGQLSWSPYWLTVQDGVIVALDEQYLP
jgi:hypothetical protein